MYKDRVGLYPLSPDKGGPRGSDPCSRPSMHQHALQLA